MKQKIDVIGIGAINFDYIFDDARKFNLHEKKSIMDDGEEKFVTEERLKTAFANANKKAKNSVKAQIGGSALLAIKTIKSMSSALTTAYVGVYGEIPKLQTTDKLPKSQSEISSHLSTFIDDTSWLFSDKVQSGCALVMLKNHRRDHIDIYTGANKLLKEKIINKGEDEFVDFLSCAKWIHMSSLEDIEQFCYICNLISKAKEKNPYLIFSIDPGYDYTKNHWDSLKTVFKTADYVFLSEIEKNNIWTYLNLSEKDSFDDFGQELINIKASPQIMIIKNISNIILLNLIQGKPFTRTYHHNRISKFKIENDTGAGDAFAGGFISGMLSPAMLSYQPAPIKLGVNAAKERLLSADWPKELTHIAIKFRKKNMKEEEKNYKQYFKDKIFPKIQLGLGVVLGWVADSVIDWIKDLVL